MVLFLAFCVIAIRSYPFLVPLPRSFHEKKGDDDVYLVLKFHSFSMTQKTVAVPELDFIIGHYREIMFYDEHIEELTQCPEKKVCVKQIDFYVNDTSTTDPGPTMIESYDISISEQVMTVECTQIFGCYRAMETITQMTKLDATEGYYVENYMPISDHPRFPTHRGLMIDTSRHYLHPHKITEIIRSLMYSKMNVLHWHIVDDQSFPVFIEKYPKLNENGAWAPEAVFSKEDLVHVAETARKFGVRVLLEFDVPGHSTSWCKSGYDICATCPGYHQILSPISQTTYDVIDDIVSEISSVFPEAMFHFGGDEVNLGCWDNDPAIQDWMKKKGWTDSKQLMAYFGENLFDIFTKHKKQAVCWEECLLSDVWSTYFDLPKETIVHVWKGGTQWDHLHDTISKLKYNALLYLNNYQTNSWKNYYLNEPFNKYNYTAEEKKRLLGGEACSWGEHISGSNYIQKVFPELLMVAERLWSDESVVDTASAAARIEYLRCQFVHRTSATFILSVGVIKTILF